MLRIAIWRVGRKGPVNPRRLEGMFFSPVGTADNSPAIHNILQRLRKSLQFYNPRRIDQQFGPYPSAYAIRAAHPRR